MRKIRVQIKQLYIVLTMFVRYDIIGFDVAKYFPQLTTTSCAHHEVSPCLSDNKSLGAGALFN